MPALAFLFLEHFDVIFLLLYLQQLLILLPALHPLLLQLIEFHYLPDVAPLPQPLFPQLVLLFPQLILDLVHLLLLLNLLLLMLQHLLQLCLRQ